MGMDEVQEIVSAGHYLRKGEKIRVRQPLSRLSVIAESASDMAGFAPIIASEVNVKDVSFLVPEESGLTVIQDLKLNPREFSPEVRPKTSALFAASKKGEWELVDEGEAVRFPTVEVNGGPVELRGDQFAVTERVEATGDEVAMALGSGAFVTLDVGLTDELEGEGWARDMVRLIQDTRKKEDLHVADRIDVSITGPKERLEHLAKFEDMIKRETLTLSLEALEGEKEAVQVARRDDGERA